MKPLQEYIKKRDFKKTAEPVGKKARTRTKALSFVVQEHHASHLHYDFRLEMDGVLKSWAVPKGPSSDPKTKRLAMQVEDHPLAYGKFEGTIPEDEYGGGEVFLWDSGTWEPTVDAHKGLKKGHLDFILKGTRMKGQWTLIRTGKGSAKPAWLLFKRSDEYANQDALFKPIAEYGSKKDPKRKTSKVKPHVEKSAAAKSDKTKSSKTKAAVKTKTKKTKSLKFIEPQLSLLVDAPPTGSEWVHEMKFDGYRIQAHIQNGKVKLYTRSGQDWTHKYETLAKELAKTDVEDAIFDGEIVALDDQGRSDFQALQMAMKAKQEKALVYYVFDLLDLNGEDLRKDSLLDRKQKLESVLPSSKQIRMSEHLETDGAQMLKASCEQNLEGIVSKQIESKYHSGRTQVWVKSKCTKRQEFVIGGYSDPQGARDHFGSLLLGVYENGKLKYAGRCGTGFNGESIKMVFQKLKKLSTKSSPFKINSPNESDIHWIKPELVAEIAFANWTKDDVLRVPVFHGLRLDKSPRDVKRETEAPVKTVKGDSKAKTKSQISPKSLSKNSDKSAKLTQEEPVTLTHPEKIIYAKEKFTKQDVADFYRAISKHILPHISDRPLSMLRCPDGTGKTCFFQKHFTPQQRGKGAHPVIHEILIEEHGGERGYATIDSTEGLVAMVQSGGFEFHAWGCRQPDIEHPDQIIMDFDPDEKVTFAEVKKAAFELRDTLMQLKLKSFVKVSGGKGVHVHIPIDTVYGWDDVKEFSKVLAQHMEENAPDRFVSTVSKAKRVGKIFVDYLRNGRSATAVVPYSLRARATSAVALPVTWDELKKIKDPSNFTLKKTIALLKKRKADPWKEMLGLKQKIHILKAKD